LAGWSDDALVLADAARHNAPADDLLRRARALSEDVRVIRDGDRTALVRARRDAEVALRAVRERGRSRQGRAALDRIGRTIDAEMNRLGLQPGEPGLDEALEE